MYSSRSTSMFECIMSTTACRPITGKLCSGAEVSGLLPDGLVGFEGFVSEVPDEEDGFAVVGGEPIGWLEPGLVRNGVPSELRFSLTSIPIVSCKAI